jgi:hypothetical protein
MYNILSIYNIHYIVYTYVSTNICIYIYVYMCNVSVSDLSHTFYIVFVLFSLRSLWPQSRRRVYLRALSWHMCIVNVRPSHFYLKALSHRRFNGATRAFKDDVCSYFKHNSRSKAECRFRVYTYTSGRTCEKAL